MNVNAKKELNAHLFNLNKYIIKVTRKTTLKNNIL